MDAKVKQREQARELARQGVSYNEITRRLHVAKSSVSNWCRDIIHELPPELLAEKLKRDRVVNIESRDIARERYRNGDASKQIAHDLNVNIATVVRWCKDIIRPRSQRIKTQRKRPPSTAPMAQSPYADHRIYHSTSKQGYNSVSLVHPDTMIQKTMSLARYLMSVKENRILNDDELVRHIDGPEDVIENLRIVTYAQEKAEFKEKSKRPCPQCGEIYIPNRAKQVFCSKTCLHVSRRGITTEVKPDVARACKGCGTSYKPKNNSQRYCSEECIPKPIRKARASRTSKPRTSSVAKVECVICDMKFIPNAPDRDVCYSKSCNDLIAGVDDYDAETERDHQEEYLTQEETV